MYEKGKDVLQHEVKFAGPCPKDELQMRSRTDKGPLPTMRESRVVGLAQMVAAEWRILFSNEALYFLGSGWCVF